MSLTSLIIFISILNTITVVAMVAWLENNKPKKNKSDYYYEEIDDDEPADTKYSWD